MTEKPSEAYLAGYFFGTDGRRTERRFDVVGVEIKAYAEGIVDGRRTARAAEDWRKAIEHERSLGLHWHDRLNIQKSASLGPGHAYHLSGVIVVDLERREVVDVPPDRVRS
jgi:hypothetical protein